MTNFKVQTNSNSKLTQGWAIYKSKQNFANIPLEEQKLINFKNKSWVAYFTVLHKLGEITAEQRSAYIGYVFQNRLHNREFNFADLPKL